MTAVRPRRQRRRRQTGQSLLIFGLASLVIFGVVGLAIDSAISYVAAGRVERAAASAALAGVTYMPDQYSTAVTAAQDASARDGYVDGVNGVAVNVYRVPQGCDASGSTTACYSNRLGVSVSVPVTNTFLRVVGFGPNHTVTQRATAEFLPTLTLGQPDPHLGSTAAQINASPPSGYYFLRHEGWGTPRTEGDAFTPNPASNGPTSDIHTLNSANEVDMTQYGGQGFGQLPDRGGYSYQLVVPSGSTARIQVYNPAFVDNRTGSGFPNGLDYKEGDTTFNSGTGATTAGTPVTHNQYDTMEYTLFKVVDEFQHNKDIPLSQIIVNPINGTDTSTANWVDARTGAKMNGSAVTALFQQWVDPTLASYTDGESGGGHLVHTNVSHTADLGAGTYRLRVDTLDGNGNWPGSNSNPSDVANGAGGGHKGYALRVVDADDTSTECTACSLGALNEFAFYTPVQGSASGTSFDVPIVDIPKQYAGQTVNVYAYDPGDVSGTNYLDVVNGQTGAIASDATNGVKVYGLGVSKTTTPSAANLLGASQPSSTQARVQTACTGTCNTGIGACSTGTTTHPFNGCWLLFKIPVPGSYNPTTLQQQYWKLRYELTGGNATDTLTVAVGFDGPPVHLVPNG